MLASSSFSPVDFAYQAWQPIVCDGDEGHEFAQPATTVGQIAPRSDSCNGNSGSQGDSRNWADVSEFLLEDMDEPHALDVTPGSSDGPQHHSGENRGSLPAEIVVSRSSQHAASKKWGASGSQAVRTGQRRGSPHRSIYSTHEGRSKEAEPGSEDREIDGLPNFNDRLDLPEFLPGLHLAAHWIPVERDALAKSARRRRDRKFASMRCERMRTNAASSEPIVLALASALQAVMPNLQIGSRRSTSQTPPCPPAPPPTQRFDPDRICEKGRADDPRVPAKQGEVDVAGI